MSISPTITPQRAQTAWDVCRRYEPSNLALALLRRGQTPKAYFDLLVQNGLDADAISFLARLLSKPEAIWWGCLCVWNAARPNPSPAAEAALEATLRWLQEPTEAHRRAAEEVARKVGVAKPAGAVAQATVFATGSMSLPGLPEVAPPGDLT